VQKFIIEPIFVNDYSRTMTRYLSLQKIILAVALLFTIHDNAGEFSTKGLLYPQIVTAFYKKRAYKPVWTDKKLLNELQQSVAGSYQHGLQPANYHYSQLQKGSDSLRTDAFIAYAHDLRFGRAPQRLKGAEWKLLHNDSDLIPVLQAALSSHEIQKHLANLAPASDSYRLLQEQLEFYRELASKRDWIAPDKPLDLESTDSKQLEVLRRLLEKTGDLTPGMKLFDGVARFQWRHGLNNDGVVGQETLAALNITAAKRVSQIEINLDRMRWIPREFPERYVFVNVPGFELRIYDLAKLVNTMRIVVGKKDWFTPTFLSSEINKIILNPYWFVPPNIAKQDIYPRLKKQPDYFKKFGIQAISDAKGDVQLRQNPGEQNLLGRIKFAFPNHSGAYLHDSPEKDLFDNVLLSFSHGCIRVEDAIGLAEWMLEKQGWTEDRLKDAIDTQKTQTLLLSHPIPLYIVYFTAWIDGDGLLQFRDDIYGKDAELEKPVLYETMHSGLPKK
jgi:murein L,D-transpeptidase YcbB/YkuD